MITVHIFTKKILKGLRGSRYVQLFDLDVACGTVSTVDVAQGIEVVSSVEAFSSNQFDKCPVCSLLCTTHPEYFYDGAAEAVDNEDALHLRRTVE